MVSRGKVSLYVIALLIIGCQEGNTGNDWEVYKADKASSSYSSLEQIDKENVDQLEVAWTYRTGDLAEDSSNHPRHGIETNPLIVDNVLYGVSPYMKAFALDAATGEELWSFDPFEDNRDKRFGEKLRGVTYWEDGSDQRLLFTAGTGLYALDANTGELIADFGEEGRVDLNMGLRRNPDSISVKAPSPGIIYQDLLILGSDIAPTPSSPPGDIRAYNVRTGEIAWTFHTIPLPGEPGFDTWGVPDDEEAINRYLNQQGGANNWTGMSLDQERGIVYVPTGSPNYDYYGGNRIGKNLYGNSLLALDAETGEHIWHFQAVHHGLWDYDLPAPPNLLTVEKDGEEIDAVAQMTKHGFLFVFNRVTGEPIFPIEERPVPPSYVEGEKAWPTQPYPTKPEPFARQHFSVDQVTDISPEAHDSVQAKLSRYRNEGLFTPPSREGTILLPGIRGAARWGGAAHDPESGILYTSVSELPEISTIREVGDGPSPGATLVERGKSYYVQNCATCHGMNREGEPPTYPALTNIAEMRSKEEVLNVIEEGGGMMPAFPTISEEEKKAIIEYLFTPSDTTEREGVSAEEGSGNEDGRYIETNDVFRDPDGYPATKPPWGTLKAINLNTGETKWTVPLGAYPELVEQGHPPTGMPNMGGPIATAGGLIFIAGTQDEKFRAFDKDTGELLWETRLPAAGFATPSTYMTNGRQYVVIGAGGGRGTEPGDYYVAFSLPR